MVSLDMISGSVIIIARGVARNYHLGRLNFNFPILWQEKFKFWAASRSNVAPPLYIYIYIYKTMQCMKNNAM